VSERPMRPGWQETGASSSWHPSCPVVLLNVTPGEGGWCAAHAELWRARYATELEAQLAAETVAIGYAWKTINDIAPFKRLRDKLPAGTLRHRLWTSDSKLPLVRVVKEDGCPVPWPNEET